MNLTSNLYTGDVGYKLSFSPGQRGLSHRSIQLKSVAITYDISRIDLWIRSRYVILISSWFAESVLQMESEEVYIYFYFSDMNRG